MTAGTIPRSVVHRPQPRLLHFLRRDFLLNRLRLFRTTAHLRTLGIPAHEDAQFEARLRSHDAENALRHHVPGRHDAGGLLLIAGRLG